MRKTLQNRVRSNFKELKEEKQEQTRVQNAQRERYEERHLGNYSKIYPDKDSQVFAMYERLLDVAKQAYVIDMNGGKAVKIRTEDPLQYE
jgi:hypothetical protein